MTLTEFLMARLAEDEAVARVCAEAFPPPWDLSDRGHSATVKADAPNFWIVSAIDQEQESPGRWPGEHIDHIARHDPARVLAQCAAHRRIVEACGPVVAYESYEGPDYYGGTEACEEALRALASIYADHPDYDPAWRLT